MGEEFEEFYVDEAALLQMILDIAFIAQGIVTGIEIIALLVLQNRIINLCSRNIYPGKNIRVFFL